MDTAKHSELKKKREKPLFRKEKHKKSKKTRRQKHDATNLNSNLVR